MSLQRRPQFAKRRWSVEIQERGDGADADSVLPELLRLWRFPHTNLISEEHPPTIAENQSWVSVDNAASCHRQA